MLEMRLPMAMSMSHGTAKVDIPVEIALRVQPWHIVPLGIAPCSQLLVVGVDIALAVIGNRGQLAVVLEFVF